jgi:hypothetical protein
MYSLNIDDFEKLIDAIKINVPDDIWWKGHQSDILFQLNIVRKRALSIAWFQGEAPLITISDKIAEQINDLKEHLCRS